jgi:stage III sporulation protein AE
LRQTEKTFSAAFAAVIFILMFQYTDSLIRLASVTVEEICAYGKLLCPVMTTALAAQGAVTSSSALYMGTTVFTAVLGSVIAKGFVPLVYGFLAISAANSALGEEYLRKIGDSIKSLLGWALKTMLILFTSYMSITGVVSGTTDAAALKAAKVTITSVVPVVGGIISGAADTVLSRASLLKNAVGVFGMLGVVAICLLPFLELGISWLLFRGISAISAMLGSGLTGLLDAISSMMGVHLGMVGSCAWIVMLACCCYVKVVHL